MFRAIWFSDIGTVIEPHDVDGEIYRRCHPCRGKHVATIDVQDVGDDIDVGVQRAKLSGHKERR
jgi:hypothetical protein